MVKKVKFQPKTEFRYMRGFLYRIAKTLGGKKYGKDIADFYAKLWNPINYAIVGGLGVLINYLIFALLISRFPWWITNAAAILTAWTWNWANSVGPLGWLWGFSEKGGEKNG